MVGTIEEIEGVSEIYRGTIITRITTTTTIEASGGEVSYLQALCCNES